MTFDTGRFTFERLTMTQKIRNVQLRYGLAPIEFTALIRLAVEKQEDLPATATFCEDVLFEILTRTYKGQQIAQWLGQKLTTDFLVGVTDPADPVMEKIRSAVSSMCSGPSENTLAAFEMYLEVFLWRHVEGKAVDLPAFSALGALDEMISDAAGPPGGE